MTIATVVGYLVGSWGVGFLFGLVFRVVFRGYTEWFS